MVSTHAVCKEYRQPGATRPLWCQIMFDQQTATTIIAPRKPPLTRGSMLMWKRSFRSTLASVDCITGIPTHPGEPLSFGDGGAMIRQLAKR